MTTTTKPKIEILRDRYGFRVRCNTHGMSHKHLTRKQARSLRKDPAWFCVGCAAELQE